MKCVEDERGTKANPFFAGLAWKRINNQIRRAMNRASVDTFASV